MANKQDCITFSVSVTQSGHPHVAEPYEALAGTVHKMVAVCWMEFGSRDDFSQLFHVGRLDVHYVETLIRDIEMPEIDAQIVSR